MKEIRQLEETSGLDHEVTVDTAEDLQDTADLLLPETVVSCAEKVRRETATPVPFSVPSLASYAVPVSPTQDVDSLLDLIEEEEAVLLPNKMISRPAATRIYHRQVHRRIVHLLTA
jgi:hypothetical protein